MRSAPLVARREWLAYVRSPAGWAVLALFLALQGIVFWLFVQFLGRPDAPPGGVMEFFFGGTILYWIALALLATVVPMRLLSEELRTGTIEPLLTAPVTPGDVVVGKWLAAVGFYLCAWAPTLLYLVYLRVVGGHVDAGPVAAGYLGTALLGGAAMAGGLLASSLTRNQLVAATLSFVAVFVTLLLGVLETQVGNPVLAAVLRRVSLFRLMEDFGHGIVDSRHLVLLGAATVVPLVAAAAVVARLRGPAPDDAPGGRLARAPVLLAPALTAVIAVMLCYLGGRHYLRGDWTSDSLYALSDKTVAVMRTLPRPVEATVFFYPRRDSEEARTLARLIRELTERLGRYAPDRFHTVLVDPDREPARAEAAARRYGIGEADMNDGVVVLTSGPRSKFLTRADLVEPEVNAEGEPQPTLRAWKGEGAFVSAILSVTSEHPQVVCFLEGDGEPSIDSVEERGYADLAEEIRRGGYETRAVKVAGGALPGGCRVLVVAEPEQALPDATLAALDAFAAGGGRVLVMLGPVFNHDASAFAHVGLERWAEGWGVRFGDNLVVDPAHASAVEDPSVWGAGPGNYAPHPVTARLGGRVTYWPRTREVTVGRPRPGTDVRPLVRSSEAGWGETDLATIRGDADLAFDAGRDRKGPVDVAVAVDAPAAGGQAATRLVFLGTGRLVMNDRMGGLKLRDYDADLVLGAIDWLAGEEQRAGIGPKTPARTSVTLDATQVAWAFRLFAVGLPLVAVVGGVLVRRRRRV
jgi:ABC-2 type transport system permease protein